GLRPLFPCWRWVLAYTVVEVSLPWFLLSDAERGLSSSLTGLLIAAVPLIGAVVTWLTRGDDRLDLRRIGGLVIGLIGVAALVGLNVSFRDLGAVGEVGLVAVGYAAGPTIGAVIGLALILLGSFYATRRSSGPAAGAAGRASNPWAVAARYRRERLRRVQGSGK